MQREGQSCLRLLAHCNRRPDSRAELTAGNSKAMSVPMIATTTSNSIKEKPAVFRIM